MTETTAIILATALGPIAAVLITLWHQDRKAKMDEKRLLFRTIMGARKSFPASYEWANALNLIVVVFDDNPEVLKAWADLFDFVQHENVDSTHFHRKQLVLLSAMAKELGHKNLQQVDIDKFYSPRVLENQALLNRDLQQELLRVLRETHQISFLPKDKSQPAD